MASTLRAALAGAAAAWILAGAAHAQGPAPDVVARGKYLTDMGDCAACHTKEGGQRFAGGLVMNTPVGGLSTPNITPDKDTGIGTYTDDEFYAVFHDGVGRAGHLYPAMPYPWYTNVTRDDVLAIKAYLMTLPPVHAPREPGSIGFPFNVRLGLAAWQVAFLKHGPFQPDPKASDEINRGAYIVQGLEHCGECHNGRKLLGDSGMAKRLQGGVIDGWYAPNITSDEHYGIGRYSDAQLAEFLKTGAARQLGTVLGPMAQTVHESLSKLNDGDIKAVVAYLKSTQAATNYTDTKKSDFTGPDATGGQTYLTYCASCHQQNGQGIAGKVPALDGSGVVAAGGPENVIRVVLGGVAAQKGYGPMGAYGASMTDEQIANVTNFIRQSWSNKAPPNAQAGDVGKLRPQTKTLLSSAECPANPPDSLAPLLADPSSGLADTLKATTSATMTQSANALLAKVRSAAPKLDQATVVNDLTAAYCPVLAADDTLAPEERVWRLNQFSTTVYTQATTKGAL